MRALFYFLHSFRFLNTTFIPSTEQSFVGDNGAIFQPPEIETVPDAEVPEIAPVETEVLLDWSEKVADEIVPAATEALSSMVETGSGAALNFVSILAIVAVIVGVLLAIALFVALVAAAILIPVLIVRSKKKKAASTKV